MEILRVFWFLLPAGFANLVPVLFKKSNFLNYPVDLGIRLRGKEIFGENKTYRGLFWGTLTGICITYIQKLLYPLTIKLALIDYSVVNVIVVGFLLGFGALAGDLIESFIKRQIGMSPGRTWIPFDQIDWIIGAMFFINFYTHITWLQISFAILLFVPLHLLIKFIGFLLEINQVKL